MPVDFLVLIESVIGRPFTAVDGKSRRGVSALRRGAYLPLFTKKGKPRSGPSLWRPRCRRSGADDRLVRSVMRSKAPDDRSPPLLTLSPMTPGAAPRPKCRPSCNRCGGCQTGQYLVGATIRDAD